MGWAVKPSPQGLTLSTRSDGMARSLGLKQDFRPKSRGIRMRREHLLLFRIASTERSAVRLATRNIALSEIAALKESDQGRLPAAYIAPIPAGVDQTFWAVVI